MVTPAVPRRGQHRLPAQAAHPQAAALFVDPARGARRLRVGRPGNEQGGSGQQLTEGSGEVGKTLSLAPLPRGPQAPYDSQRGRFGPRQPGQPPAGVKWERRICSTTSPLSDTDV
ncbi:hypothetical protein GCM10009647_075470 [Streptomyces sanglieri]